MASGANQNYTGRFAPSPTGPLHAGSLLAALASYLDARAHGGRWLLRIEDVDLHRNVQGATDLICRSLEAHRLFWDGDILQQSTRDERYKQALQDLQASGDIFYCNCSRKMLKQLARGGNKAYPGYCREQRNVAYQAASATQPASHAVRFAIGALPATAGNFDDRVLGPQCFDLMSLGDFIVRRRDGLFAYQLAVVVDDAEQAVTDVVRGADLLDSTPWQLCLQRALGHPTPRYAHLPLLVHANAGGKLSKQTGAAAIDDRSAYNNLCLALQQLGQTLPTSPTEKSAGDAAKIDALLAHAVENWSISRVPRSPIAVPNKGDSAMSSQGPEN
ncbi:MAG: tRNA glutamyl-Q(34) synthetase GluQRS [Pseudomonadales bacterium]|nr:tRNA glutamyl-Q(34) synthetase GluQRS [Pseudomonadales bacterium]